MVRDARRFPKGAEACSSSAAFSRLALVWMAVGGAFSCIALAVRVKGLGIAVVSALASFFFPSPWGTRTARAAKFVLEPKTPPKEIKFKHNHQYTGKNDAYVLLHEVLPLGVPGAGLEGVFAKFF